jgi:hypothetical protein
MSKLKLLELPSADAKVAHGTPIQLARRARVAPRRLWVPGAVVLADGVMRRLCVLSAQWRI